MVRKKVRFVGVPRGGMPTKRVARGGMPTKRAPPLSFRARKARSQELHASKGSGARRKGPCQSYYHEACMCRVYWGQNKRTGKTCGKTDSYTIAKRKGIRTTWPNYRRCKPGTIRIPN